MMQRLHPAQGPLGAGNSALDQKVLAVGSESPTMMAPSPAAARPSEAVLATVAMASEPAAAASTPAAASPAGVSAAPSASGGTRPRRYMPVRQLGEGGMGEVLLSVDSAIGRQVAVKRMKPRPDLADASGQFLAEVQTTGQLEHPGIVPIYDAGQDEEGNPYFVMKWERIQKKSAISGTFEGDYMPPSGGRSCARRAPTSSPGITLGSGRSPGGPRWET